jgi:D-serine deaminase-like pyridoxal phosphate-dependent protein
VKLDDLPTPCLVLDRGILQRNLDTMARAVARHNVALRPHMKTAKSIDVARMALANPHVRTQGITVSTLAEAEYFVGHGVTDIIYSVGITPQKLDQIGKLNATGATVTVITDDAGAAAAIAAHASPPRTLIEIDCGEHRGGIDADDPALLEIAGRLGDHLAGVLTHAGHSYTGRSAADMTRIAEDERSAAARAAERLTQAGFAPAIVSVGSSPTALYAERLDGVTEVRPGVYMFGDLYQAEIGTHAGENIAVTVLASVIGRRPAERCVLVDAGALALSKDRSTESAPHDFAYGLVLDIQGRRSFGRTLVRRVNQEHGRIEFASEVALPDLPIGGKLRIAPNHTCLMAAAHDRYFVIDGGDTVVAVWPRVNGW